MSRSLTAVLLGTFTLRFSTGLTGALLVYYLADLESFGAPEVTAFEVGLLTAAFYVAELVLSPLFGMLADRIGTRRVMQYGPAFGAVAVLMTAVTTHLLLLGVTRWLEGAAAAASIPSILGFIALTTSRDEQLRGRAVARFEAATLAGLGLGLVAAGPVWEVLGRNGFFLNAVLYGVSFLIYRYGVTDDGTSTAEAGPARSPARTAGGWDRFRTLLSSRSVWLLAPTWIAINAFIGAWMSQSIFQLVNDPPPGFENQRLMGGFEPWQISVGMAVALVIFFAGLLYWGNRFKAYRRTTIMAIGAGGGIGMVGAIAGLNHAPADALALSLALLVVMATGLFVLAGATPAALGMLADISEEHPEDRGAVMGLYSVFLAVGQIAGSLAGGSAADWRGIDGLLIASTAMLILAMLPLRGLRASEHLVGAG
ncbi:MAG: MFS transporter [Chloroflexi bacterium]|nr:MFS transporter [Chloroflexota bacterium]